MSQSALFMVRNKLLKQTNFFAGATGEIMYQDSWGQEIFVELDEREFTNSWPRLAAIARIYWGSMDEFSAVAELLAAYIDESASTRLPPGKMLALKGVSVDIVDRTR